MDTVPTVKTPWTLADITPSVRHAWNDMLVPCLSALSSLCYYMNNQTIVDNPAVVLAQHDAWQLPGISSRVGARFQTEIRNAIVAKRMLWALFPTLAGAVEALPLPRHAFRLFYTLWDRIRMQAVGVESGMIIFSEFITADGFEEVQHLWRCAVTDIPQVVDHRHHYGIMLHDSRTMDYDCLANTLLAFTEGTLRVCVQCADYQETFPVRTLAIRELRSRKRSMPWLEATFPYSSDAEVPARDVRVSFKLCIDSNMSQAEAVANGIEGVVKYAKKWLNTTAAHGRSGACGKIYLTGADEPPQPRNLHRISGSLFQLPQWLSTWDEAVVPVMFQPRQLMSTASASTACTPWLHSLRYGLIHKAFLTEDYQKRWTRKEQRDFCRVLGLELVDSLAPRKRKREDYTDYACAALEDMEEARERPTEAMLPAFERYQLEKQTRKRPRLLCVTEI